jgi:GH24 family phage-related lysozyme (muramidase)
MANKKISQVGIDLIKSFEGCQLTAYNATGKEKYLTIGYGHYGPDVSPGMTITQEQAEQMLVQDLQRYVDYVNNPSYVTIVDILNQHQFDALVSFCYNCGPGNLQDLCKGKRTPEAIAEDLPKYNKGGGVVLPGLVRRRQVEVDLFWTEVEEEMKLELWQWTMIGDALTGLSQKGVIEYQWAEKAYKQELSPSDLFFLMPIMFARSNGIEVEARE